MSLASFPGIGHQWYPTSSNVIWLVRRAGRLRNPIDRQGGVRPTSFVLSQDSRKTPIQTPTQKHGGSPLGLLVYPQPRSEAKQAGMVFLRPRRSNGREDAEAPSE
jgi:hypothetical protein